MSCSNPAAQNLHPIYRLTADDTQAIVQYITGLDGPELWDRFLRNVTPAQVSDHYAAMDWANTIVLCWKLDDGICALAEVILHDGPAGRQAEIALTVRCGWRGRTIGEQLLAAAVAAASERGAARCVLVVRLGDDTSAIVRRLGGTVDLAAGLATLGR
jgi:GNAT superfamily N-acetyltransferase